MKQKQSPAGLPEKLLLDWYEANREVAEGERFRVEIQPGVGFRSALVFKSAQENLVKTHENVGA